MARPSSGRSVHTPVPATRTSRIGTAQPPLTGVVPTSQWYAERYVARERRRPWWRQLLRQP